MEVENNFRLKNGTKLCTNLINKTKFWGMLEPPLRMGNEWRLPSIEGVTDISFYGPITLFFALFNTIGYTVKKFNWKNYGQFEKYRLKNTIVSFVHSVVSGGCSLLFLLKNPKIMFEDTLHWYEAWAAQLVLFTIAYFIYDAFDIIINERTQYAFEIVIHHIVAICIFSTGMLSHKFLPYAYWALLVEVNSAFLHFRTILQIVRINLLSILYKTISILSIITFVVFRFGVLFWMAKYMVLNRNRFHLFFACAGLIAVSFFIILSVFLFIRILYDDGLIREYNIRKPRDKTKAMKMAENVKIS